MSNSYLECIDADFHNTQAPVYSPANDDMYAAFTTTPTHYDCDHHCCGPYSSHANYVSAPNMMVADSPFVPGGHWDPSAFTAPTYVPLTQPFAPAKKPSGRQYQAARELGEAQRLMTTRARVAVLNISPLVARQDLMIQFGFWFAEDPKTQHIIVHDADVIEATDRKPRMAYITLNNCTSAEADEWCRSFATFFAKSWRNDKDCVWRVERAHHQPAQLNDQEREVCLNNRRFNKTNPNNNANKQQLSEEDKARRWRTRICRNFTNGVACPFGDSCYYAHGFTQLRKETDPLPVNYSFASQHGM